MPGSLKLIALVFLLQTSFGLADEPDCDRAANDGIAFEDRIALNPDTTLGGNRGYIDGGRTSDRNRSSDPDRGSSDGGNGGGRGDF